MNANKENRKNVENKAQVKVEKLMIEAGLLAMFGDASSYNMLDVKRA